MRAVTIGARTAPRRRPRATASLLAIVMALQGVQAAVPGATLAAGTANCGQDQNHWKGQSASNANQKHGASGTFEAFQLQMCDNPGLIDYSGSFVLSNVVPANGGANDIVQIGMGNCRHPTECPGGMHYYSGWGRTTSTAGCGSFSNRLPIATNEGDYVSALHDFKVYHKNNSWRMFVDQAEVLAVGEGSICWTPKIAMWFGENWDVGDQIGGTAGNHLSVTQTNSAAVENGGFFWTNFNPANACDIGNPAPYFCDIKTDRSFDIWTDR